MTSTRKVIVMHDLVPLGARPDELDVLIQARSVSEALTDLNCEVSLLQFSLDLRQVIGALSDGKPDFVINLVESVEGDGRLIFLAPAILTVMGLPHTGSGTTAMFLTSNKVTAKEMMLRAGISTPEWLTANDGNLLGLLEGVFIVKSLWEHASIGLEDDYLITGAETGRLLAILEDRKGRRGAPFFAERYIEGREFNISILAGAGGPEVLPAAEMTFRDYRRERPRVVDYRAKWEKDSFEDRHTTRRFDFPLSDRPLLEELSCLALRCWNLFGLRGYGRLDFRVDESGQPWVLEINANPCLSPDGGLAATAAAAGFSYTELIRRIAADLSI